MKNSDIENNRLSSAFRKKRKYISVMLVLCLSAGMLSGCGFVSNPMQYMKDADKELVEDQNANSNSRNSDSSIDTQDDVNPQIAVTDNKIIAIGTYGSISDMINTDDYKSQADIECIQETRDFDDTSDMLALVKKVQESVNTDAESVIISVRKRVYDQISYLLEHTVSTSKGLIVICEDEKNTDYNKVFEEALNIAVGWQSQPVAAESEHSSYGKYNVINRLKDMDVIDVSDVNSLPYVNVVYDYIGNDVYSAQKAFDISEAVVVVTENSDGSLSLDMAQLVNDYSSLMPIVIVCNNNNSYNYAADEYGDCIVSSGMSAEQARIMAMLCLTKNKNKSDWEPHFTHLDL